MFCRQTSVKSVNFQVKKSISPAVLLSLFWAEMLLLTAVCC
jgi:hypothetical protein